MSGLEEKFDKEITDSCRIIASRFPLPNWQPVRIIGEGLDTVWIYMHPRNSDYEQLKMSVNSNGLNNEDCANEEIQKDKFRINTVLSSNK
jgi:hypothetical protein